MESLISTRALKVLVIGMGVLIIVFAALLTWGVVRGMDTPSSHDAPLEIILQQGEQLREFNSDDGVIFIRIERADGSQRIVTFRDHQWQERVVIIPSIRPSSP